MCFHIAFCLPLSFIAKLLYSCLAWLSSALAAVWGRTGLDLLRSWFRLNYYRIKKMDWGGVYVCVCDPRPLQLSSSPVQHCEFCTSPAQHLGHCLQTTMDTGMSLRGNRGETEAWLRANIKDAQDINTWIVVVVSIIFVRWGKEHTQGDWEPAGICWRNENVESNPTRLGCRLVLAKCLQERSSCSSNSSNSSQLQSSLFSEELSNYLSMIPVGTGWILGRTRHPPDCKPDGSRLSCYCPCSNKKYRQGGWDCDGVIDKIIHTRADCKHTKKINTGVLKVADPGLKIWMQKGSPPPKEAQSDDSATVRGWRPARQLPPQLHCSKGQLLQAASSCTSKIISWGNFRHMEVNLVAELAISVWKVYTEWGRKKSKTF